MVGGICTSFILPALLTRVVLYRAVLFLRVPQVDMLVGDIYGGRDYASVGLSASTIASSFGKVVGQDKELADYNPAGENHDVVSIFGFVCTFCG